MPFQGFLCLLDFIPVFTSNWDNKISDSAILVGVKMFQFYKKFNNISLFKRRCIRGMRKLTKVIEC